MGELLRAVMDKKCLDSRPAFYTLFVQKPTVPIAPGPFQTFLPRTTFLQCKADTWFLGMSYTMLVLSFDPAGVNPGGQITSQQFGVKLTDARSGHQFSNINIQQMLLNYNLNSMTSLDDYFLLYPNQLIQADIDVIDQNANPTLPILNYYIILSGVEYLMPS